jgi:copper chaperone CopZ
MLLEKRNDVNIGQNTITEVEDFAPYFALQNKGADIMQMMKFKTNINCAGCLRGVTPALDVDEAIERWDVDLQSPARTLTVETEALTADEVKALVAGAGYEAELIA